MNQEMLESFLRRFEAVGLCGEARPCGDSHYSLPCPFAPWKHKNGEDRKPSATISFGEERSFFRCHSCGLKTPLAKAIAMLSDLNNGAWNTFAIEVAEIERGQKIVIKSRQEKKSKPEPDYIDRLRLVLRNDFPKEAKAFLEGKHVPFEVARKFYCAYLESYEFPRVIRGELRPIHAENAILFPVLRKANGVLTCPGAQVRPLNAGKDDLKYYSIFPFKATRYLFGEHLLPLIHRKILFIVEGPLDTMHIWSEKHCALGLLGLYMSDERAAKIQAAAPRRTYILLDPDQAEYNTALKIQEKLDKVKVAAEIAVVKEDPRTLTKEDLSNI